MSRLRLFATSVVLGMLVGYGLMSPLAMVFFHISHARIGIDRFYAMQHSLTHAVTDSFSPDMAAWWAGFTMLGALLGGTVGVVVSAMKAKETKISAHAHALSEANRKIEEAYRSLEKRAREVMALEEKLREADKLSALGELGAVIAHEMMNPLGSIKGAMEILQDDFPEGHDKRAFLDILIREIDRLDRTVRGILRFRTQEDLKKTSCDPEELIETLLVLIQGEVRRRQVRVRRQFANQGTHLDLDPDKMQQVLLNLFMNALQAMPCGGELTVVTEWGETPPPEIVSAGASHGRGLLLSVSDTGEGIGVDHLEKVFEPLYTTREKGTGLGLAISKKIIQAHGGAIWAESRAAEGSTFRIWLP